MRESLGLDSVNLVTLVVRAQGRFNIGVRSEELEKVTTVSHLLDLPQTKMAAAAQLAV